MTSDGAICIIGAGIGGLAAALRLAHAGLPVTVLEAARAPGGKMRCVPSAAGPVDAGPTVLTLKLVFEALFADVGERLEDHVTLHPNPVLARHFWTDGTRFDLMADSHDRRDEVERIFGARAARDFDRFQARTDRLFRAFDAPMMQAAAPSRRDLALRVVRQPRLLGDMAPHRSLMNLLRASFSEPRLAQLFARYATYVGGLPQEAPALLSLVWQAEARGVWSVAGGMHELAAAIAALAEARGARFLYDTPATGVTLSEGAVTGVTTPSGIVDCDTVLFNGDPRALHDGRLGEALSHAVDADAVGPRSLSAHVLAFAATPHGPELSGHNVFFGDDPMAEFAPLARGAVPDDATLYICAQDRGAGAVPGPLERFEIIRNAPPALPDDETEIARCHDRIFQRLGRFGLGFCPQPATGAMTTPAGFAQLFPGSQGSLYGRSPAGLTAALRRPRARTAIPGLYLVGGGAHPGAGVPMATLSARHAAEAILTDRASISTSRPAATRGGMSTA